MYDTHVRELTYDPIKTGIENGYVVEERVVPHQRWVSQFNRQYKRYPTNTDIVQYYRGLGAGFAEPDLYSMRIVVTERAQVNAYEAILRTMLFKRRGTG